MTSVWVLVTDDGEYGIPVYEDVYFSYEALQERLRKEYEEADWFHPHSLSAKGTLQEWLHIHTLQIRKLDREHFGFSHFPMWVYWRIDSPADGEILNKE